MDVIGLTGSLGTGKSTVAGMFAGLGAKVIDADRIARRLMRPGTNCFKQIVKMFGTDLLRAGKIDRRKMAERVFRDEKALGRLERIIHPEVRREILKQIKSCKHSKRNSIVVIDVPLLFEARLERNVDKTLVVTAKRAQQIERATRALKITKAGAMRRIKAQMPLRQKIRLADMIIDNSGTKQQTQIKVKQLWEKLLPKTIK